MELTTHKFSAPKKFDTTWLTLHLGQISCPITSRCEIVDVPGNTDRVEALLDILLDPAADVHHPAIAVLPELGMSKACLPKVVERFAKAARGRILVAGLDRTTAADATKIIEIYGTPDQNQHRFLGGLSPSDLVNTTAVVARGGGNQAELRLLFKHGSSVLETSGPLAGEHIHGPDYLELFELKGFHFAVLTCSDLFTRPPGAPARLIDELNYRLWRRADHDNAPVLLINHQRTPDTDDDRFVESLRRIYDGAAVEAGSAQYLCTVMLNHAEDVITGGGESLVVLHREKSRRTQSAQGEYDWVKAPVRGYRAPTNELVMTVGMRRPDHSLAPQDEPDSINIGFRRWENGWQEAPELRCRHVIEADALPVHHASLIAVAEGMAEHQQFDAAIRWAERAFSISSKRDAYHRAEARFIMAVNARRSGELERASALFSDAAGLVDEGDVDGDEHLLALSWQIRFARTLLDHSARDGYPEIALARLDELEDEAVEQGVADRVGTDLDLHEARLKLQRGELQMLVGAYEEARESFESSFTLLGWENSSEKALACSGLIHAAIFRGNFQVAGEHMRELQRYLRVAPESRVAWRYWQFACEMNLLVKLRLLGIPVADSALTTERRLRTMTEQGTFRVEMIKAMLTLGGGALARDPAEALDLFSEAEILADARPVAKPPMREGKPTGTLPDRLRLERAHALLGQADAHRLKGELDKAASMFQKTRRFYAPRAIRWGIERAELGIWLCARKQSPPFQTDSVGASLVELLIADPASELPIFLCTP